MRAFQTLLKLRRLAEEKTADSLAGARKRLAQGKQQGCELATLASEYADQHATRPPDSANQLKRFRLFYAELHAAVAQQSKSIEHLERALEEQQASFLQRHTERRALQSVIEERERVHKSEAKRAERKFVDGLFRLP